MTEITSHAEHFSTLSRINIPSTTKAVAVILVIFGLMLGAFV